MKFVCCWRCRCLFSISLRWRFNIVQCGAVSPGSRFVGPGIPTMSAWMRLHVLSALQARAAQSTKDPAEVKSHGRMRKVKKQVPMSVSKGSEEEPKESANVSAEAKPHGRMRRVKEQAPIVKVARTRAHMCQASSAMFAFALECGYALTARPVGPYHPYESTPEITSFFSPLLFSSRTHWCL